jgi:cysteine desulfurase/selenocysteine lyase
MGPYQTGGDMIEYVMDDRTTWNVLPHKFEAGTPNVAGAVGLAAAVEYLERLGMERVAEHERMILVTAIDSLTRLDGVRLLGPPLSRRSGVVSFVVDDIHPHDLATVLDGFGVCVRAGHHCAQPLMRRLGVPATTRASFYVYTDASDVERLAEGIVRAQGMFATPTAPPR